MGGGGGCVASITRVAVTACAVPVSGVNVSEPVYVPSPSPAGLICALTLLTDAVLPEARLEVSHGWFDETVKLSALPEDET